MRCIYLVAAELDFFLFMGERGVGLGGGFGRLEVDGPTQQQSQHPGRRWMAVHVGGTGRRNGNEARLTYAAATPRMTDDGYGDCRGVVWGRIWFGLLGWV